MTERKNNGRPFVFSVLPAVDCLPRIQVCKISCKSIAFTLDYRCGRQRDTGHHGPHQWIWRESKTSAPNRQVYHPEIEHEPFSE